MKLSVAAKRLKAESWKQLRNGGPMMSAVVADDDESGDRIVCGSRICRQHSRGDISDHAYIAHCCSRFPALVKALKDCYGDIQGEFGKGCDPALENFIRDCETVVIAEPMK